MSDPMRIGMLCSRIRVEEKLLRDALVHRGIEVEIVDDRELTFTLAQPGAGVGTWCSSAASRRHAGSRSLRVLESWGVPTVNTHAVAATCASKLDTTAALDGGRRPDPRDG